VQSAMCTEINYKSVPLTNLNKYLHYGTSGTEDYIYIYIYIYIYTRLIQKVNTVSL